MALTVLVVDDSPVYRSQVSLALQGAGFQVVEAVDGLDGLTKLSSAIHLVICDLNMPRLDGLKLLERVTRGRTQPGPTIPVLMLTTEGERTLVGRAKALGARGWIVKPFRADQLIAAVRRVLSPPGRRTPSAGTAVPT